MSVAYRSTCRPTIRQPLSVDISTNISVDCRPTYRPMLDRYVGRYVDRHISVDISAECRPIVRPTYRSSIGRVSVEGCTKYTWSKITFLFLVSFDLPVILLGPPFNVTQRINLEIQMSSTRKWGNLSSLNVVKRQVLIRFYVWWH